MWLDFLVSLESPPCWPPCSRPNAQEVGSREIQLCGLEPCRVSAYHSVPGSLGMDRSRGWSPAAAPQPPDDCIGMRSGVLLADIGSIHRWNPAVVDSRMTSEGEVGIGSSRRRELGEKNYLDEEAL